MGQLFGTDGIRGVANTYPITCEVALKFGRAAGFICKKNNFKDIIIGKDTRLSGDMLEAALSAGITSTGINVLSAGVIPTPGVAFLCANTSSAGAGIVISASHNPFEDNGIKMFNHDGMKLSDEQEEGIEQFILSKETMDLDSGAGIGTIRQIEDAGLQYARFLLDRFVTTPSDQQEPSRKLKLVVDCSNGAASIISGQVFNNDLFDTTFIHNQPDGQNINDQCGSQHTQNLKKAVLSQKADIGLAFDGDADRLIAVDEAGTQITGDCIIAICAIFAHQKHQLKNSTVVTTIMSNIGLTQAFRHHGIQHLKSDVGDRRVLEEMVSSGAVIGGEDSGHMIFLDDHSTGDGMLSALKLIQVILEENKPLSELSKIMTVYPQVLMNIEVPKTRPDLFKIDSIVNTINRVEGLLKDSGRVLVRYSGTQPLVRVMVEGPEQKLIEQYCQTICDAIKSAMTP